MFSVRPILANDLATLRRFVNHSMSQEHVRYVGVLDPDDVVMHSDLDELRKRRDNPASRAAVASETTVIRASFRPGGDERLFNIFVPVTAAGARLGTVVIGYTRMAVELELSRSRRQMMSVWLLAAALAGVFAFALASYFAAPIMSIAEAMQSAPEGDVKAVLEVGRPTRSGSSRPLFNEMAEDLSRHRRHLEELVDGRTAELRQSNAQLKSEIAERTRVESDLRTSRPAAARPSNPPRVGARAKERTAIAARGPRRGRAGPDRAQDGHRVAPAPAEKRRQGTDAPRRTSWSGSGAEGRPPLTRRSRGCAASHASLRPGVLDDLGLPVAIEWQAREFESRSGVRCEVRSDLVDERARPRPSHHRHVPDLPGGTHQRGASRRGLPGRRRPQATSGAWWR